MGRQTFIVVHLVLRLEYRVEGFVTKFSTDLKDDCGGGRYLWGGRS